MPHNFKIFAPAKVNLFLHVTGKRPDGYHTLQSLVGFADIGDELEFAEHDSLYIDVDGPFAAPLENLRDNLVYKAAQLLSKTYGVPPRGKIILTKNLPVASGLGGGSSDAAATLKGLEQLWHLPEDPVRMQEVAQQLGADVPVCMYKKLAWVEGIGEKVTCMPETPEMHFVLANPLVPTPTADVFRRFRSRPSDPVQFSSRRKSAAGWIADIKIYRNDLTDAAIAVTPVIKEVLFALGSTEGCLLHRLCGSGATCFGIYDTAESARAAADMLAARHPDWWVVDAAMLR